MSDAYLSASIVLGFPFSYELESAYLVALNSCPLCVVDNKKGWISVNRYPAFVNPDSHSIGFSSFLS